MSGLDRLSDDVKRVRLFFVSYVPLWTMIALRSMPQPVTLDRQGKPAWASIGFGFLAIWFLCDAIRLVNGSQGKGAIKLKFTDIKDEGSSVAAYLATYLLPFLGMTPIKLGDWLAYGVYLIVGITIFVRSDLALVNPTLYILGWRLVRAKILTAEELDNISTPQLPRAAIVLCRNPTALENGVELVRLAGCYVTKRETRNHVTKLSG